MTLATARRRLIAFATATALTVVVVPAARSDATTDPPTAQATAGERVVTRFLDAYGHFKANRALKLLTEDTIVRGNGWPGGWGSRERFRSELAYMKAQGVELIVNDCEEQSDTALGASVRCAFDYHAIRSDEVGLGPYSDNYWDFVVRNGKITSSAATWAYLTNGFSAERWEPFQAWVTGTHPEDLPVMYPVGDTTITEESIRLWEQRSKEWVAAVKAGSA